MAPSATESFPLASERPGDTGSTNAPGVSTGTDAGASGDSDNSMSLSTGGLVAIIVVVVVVAIVGISTGTLFFIAKKREWTMKETLRKSARKVKTALTPRRAQFPSSLKDPEERSSRRRKRELPDDVPPTPRLRAEDAEKGLSQAELKKKRHT